MKQNETEGTIPPYTRTAEFSQDREGGAGAIITFERPHEGPPELLK